MENLDVSQQDFLINIDQKSILKYRMTDSGISKISVGKSQHTLERGQKRTNSAAVV